jgi:hypothetical protein
MPALLKRAMVAIPEKAVGKPSENPNTASIGEIEGVMSNCAVNSPDCADGNGEV